ncbi:MAG: hypothetical protein K0B01_00775 [Syntrophobacterales bacterium]|nr:hypothetical protein [Syntrophobacterales bacterium]
MQNDLKQSEYQGAMPEEDEINLLDLFIVLLRHKVMIISVVFLAGVAAVVASLLMTNIYRSEVMIAPTAQEKGGALSALGGFGAMIASEGGIGAGGSLEQFEVVLKSRELTGAIVREKNLLPVLFEDSWDAAAKKWKDEPPKTEDIYKAVEALLDVKPDKKKNVMTVAFQSKDPAQAKQILDYFVVGMSEFLRQQKLEEALAQQKHLYQQLALTTDPLLKNKLYELIAKQIETETLAKVQKYYSFNIIDPSFVPERKFKPKRAQICLLTVVVAFFIAIFLAFFLEYIKNIGTREDPERLANLRKYLRFRTKDGPAQKA